MSRGRLHQKVCLYNKRLVYVRNHTYLDDTYQRLSNWVTFSYVGDDGIVERATHGDYDGAGCAKGTFSPVVKRVEILVRDWDGVGESA